MIRSMIQSSADGPRTGPVSSSSADPAARRGRCPASLATASVRSPRASPAGRCAPSRAPAPGRPCPAPRPRRARSRPARARRLPTAARRRTGTRPSPAAPPPPRTRASGTPRPSGRPLSRRCHTRVVLATAVEVDEAADGERDERHEPGAGGDRQQRHEREHRHQVALVDPCRQHEEAEAQEDRGRR